MSNRICLPSLPVLLLRTSLLNKKLCRYFYKSSLVCSSLCCLGHLCAGKGRSMRNQILGKEEGMWGCTQESRLNLFAGILIWTIWVRISQSRLALSVNLDMLVKHFFILNFFRFKPAKVMGTAKHFKKSSKLNPL
jgi:hypothetical protein